MLSNCSCLVIKPHIVAGKASGQIIDRVLKEGFEISALQLLHLERSEAAEFLDVYRGLLPEF